MSDILHILQHSLGVDQFGRGERYRNHFVTGEGSVDYPICMEAVERGLMHRRSGNALTGGNDLFTVTDAGKAWVGENSPKPDRKQMARDKYSRFLNISDCMPDLTFGEFLRREKEFAA